MHVNQATLVGSNPEPSVSVPEELIRIDITVRKQRVRSHCGTYRIRFEFATGDLLTSGAAHAKYESPVIDLGHVTDSRSRRRISAWWARLPPPKPRLGAGPQSA